MLKVTSLTAALVVLSQGCSSRNPEPPAAESSGRVAQAVTASGSGNLLPGYNHLLSSSHFKIGSSPTLELNNGQIQRWRGSLGAFAIDPGNGSACGLLDATSPKGPYILDDVAHGNNVKNYFVGAGIPADQVGEIQATYQSARMGGQTSNPAPTQFELASVTSILRRRVSGVLIVESEAWAKMTTNGDVDMECVFWPALDMSVINQAVEWAGAMANSSTRSAYKGKLPGTVYKDVGVVVHHTDMSVHAAATAYASYDVVLDPDTSAAVRHFDQNGVEFRLPQEVASKHNAHPVRP